MLKLQRIKEPKKEMLVAHKKDADFKNTPGASRNKSQLTDFVSTFPSGKHIFIVHEVTNKFSPY